MLRVGQVRNPRAAGADAVKTRTRILLLILGLGVFIYLVFDFGLESILLNLRRTGWWFVPIVAVWGAVYWMNARAWYLVLHTEEPDPGFARILQLTITGFAINYITPFLNLGGEPYRVISLRESVGLPRAASSVILYYITRVLGHCLFWLGWIVLILFSVQLSLQGVVLFGLLFLAVAGAVVFFFARYRKGIFASLLAWLPRIPMLRRLRGVVERRKDALLEIDGQIVRLHRFRSGAFYAALAYEIGSRLVASLEFYFILLAIGSKVTLVDAITINAASSLILNLLFFIPFELGAREGGLYLILHSIGYMSGLGVFIGLVNRLRELVWILVGLLLMLFRRQRPSKAKLVDFIGANSRT
jgi:hypothetical protein